MIPIIFKKTKPYSELKKDRTNGRGKLSECLKCVAIEELNGIYILKLKVPVSAKHFKDLEIGDYLKIKPNETSNEQLFRINRMSKPLNGIVSIEANHISYDLNKTSVLPFETVNGATSATTKLIDRLCRNKDDWEFITDSTNANSAFKQEVPCSFRKCLGGKKGSFLDVFGGEFEFDNFTVKHKLHRGVDKGFAIKYGKNLTDIKQDVNIDRTYSHVLPFARKDENSKTILGSILILQKSSEYKILNLDVSNKFEDGEEITKDKIDKHGWDYVHRNKPQNPKVNITVSFVNLADTEEYKDIVQLERVGLGDTVSVEFEELGVSSTSKVVKYEYDCLNERYNKIEIGDIKSNLNTTIKNAINEATAEVDQKVNTIQSAIDDQQKIIEDQTNMITGGLGGFIVHTFNANNQPEEILILDKPKIADAVNVIRMNKNGIGFSNNGIDGPFKSAWTIDGKFNANFISAGILKGILVEAVNIVGSQLKFGSDPNSITLKDNPNGQGCLFEGDGTVKVTSKGSQSFENKSANNHIQNQIKQWCNSAVRQIFLYNYQGDNKIANSLSLEANNHPRSNHMFLKNKCRLADKDSNEIRMTSDAKSNEMAFVNSGINAGNKMSNLVALSSDNDSNGLTLTNYERSKGVISNGVNLYSFASNNGLSLRNFNGKGSTSNEVSLMSLKGSASNNIRIVNFKGDKTEANNIQMEASDDRTSMSLTNYCAGKYDFRNNLDFYGADSFSQVSLSNDFGKNVKANEVKLFCDKSGNSETALVNRDANGNAINLLELTNRFDRAISLINYDSKGKFANSIQMRSNTFGNTLKLINNQRNTNESITNGEISISDSINYDCQNWHNFTFKGDDPQFRIGGYKGMNTDITVKNWNGKNLKLVFRYGILVDWYEV